MLVSPLILMKHDTYSMTCTLINFNLESSSVRWLNTVHYDDHKTGNGLQGFQTPIENGSFLLDGVGSFGQMHSERGLTYFEVDLSGHMYAVNDFSHERFWYRIGFSTGFHSSPRRWVIKKAWYRRWPCAIIGCVPNHVVPNGLQSVALDKIRWWWGCIFAKSYVIVPWRHVRVVVIYTHLRDCRLYTHMSYLNSTNIPIARCLNCIFLFVCAGRT